MRHQIYQSALNLERWTMLITQNIIYRKKTTKQIFTFLFGLLLLNSGHGYAFAVNPALLLGDEEKFLFTEPTDLSASAKLQLEKLTKRNAVITVEPVKINLSALVFDEKTKGEAIAFNVDDTKALHLKIASKKHLKDGSYLIQAIDFNGQNNAASSKNEATLIINKQNVSGIIRSADGQIYELEPLDDHNIGLIHIDASKYPPELPIDTINQDSTVGADLWDGQRNFFIRPKKALKANSKLSAITALPTSKSVENVNLATYLLSDKKRLLNLNLTPNINLPVVFSGQEPLKNSGYIWRGKIINSRNGQVTLAVNNNKITGIIRTDTDNYVIEPTTNKKSSALVRLDLKGFPPEHPTGNIAGTEGTTNAGQYTDSDLINSDANPANKTIIKVLVAYTPKARQAVADINGQINIALSEANQSYANSGIPIELQLVNTFEVNYNETGNFETDLKRFRVNGDAIMDGVHTRRTKYKADIAVLFVNNDSSCGLASTIGAKASTAFAAVHYGCAVGYYSFAHEIGHLQGARHDRESGNSGIDKICKNTAYGYFNASQGWRTIMAYNNFSCINGACNRIPYWSNPGINYQGSVTGEATKNNASCLIKTRNTVAKFK